jgi:hypothetical protein
MRVARPARVSITRGRRTDGSVTFGLRVRVEGADDRVPLGNTNEGWGRGTGGNSP